MTLQPYKHLLPTFRPIVLFSKNYLPMARINLKRATVLLVTGRAEPVDLIGQPWQMRSPGLTFEIPEHSRLRTSDRIWKTPLVNQRERQRCHRYHYQYCGSKRQLTLDHGVPRSQGGSHSWDDVVIACASYNAHKHPEAK